MKRDKGVQATARFDALKLAEAGAMLEGDVDPGQLPRLSDRVVPVADAPRIAWRIVGGHDALGHPLLNLSLHGKAFMTCQRCLSSFAVPVAQETVLLLARNERELARLDAEEPEVVLADAPLEPAALVEDELLLSLPFAPRHAAAECAATAPASAVTTAADKPFAQLAGLKARQQPKN